MNISKLNFASDARFALLNGVGMTPGLFQELYLKGKIVYAGADNEDGFHWMFYNGFHKRFFVAVIGRRNFVVTILSLQQYKARFGSPGNLPMLAQKLFECRDVPRISEQAIRKLNKQSTPVTVHLVYTHIEPGMAFYASGVISSAHIRNWKTPWLDEVFQERVFSKRKVAGKIVQMVLRCNSGGLSSTYYPNFEVSRLELHKVE
jgi:hypothetical protein